jgi:type II secretory ATPase GspE/PulE/Tfp pilus assembly ATPase PilB-like protein
VKLFDGVRRDPIVFLVDTILFEAIRLGTSDIHLECLSSFVRLRYRIDGFLHDQKSIPINEGLQAISRIKILSDLDISERRLPQDGKFMVEAELDSNVSRNVDLRVSTFPTVYGEKVVIRILDRHANNFSLDSLGFDSETLRKVEELIQKPNGLFLVTGPTGSGKSTTLYSIISRINSPERNIVTMEDPVEYRIDGVTQSQINEKINFTFSRGLRSLLRQDPDVVMVGEIRDRETARIASEAALTGHLVLSTLHTNDSIGAITRLVDIGVEPFLVTGCKKCSFLGHRGRVGLFELLVIDEEVCRMIMKRSTASEIKDYLVKRKMKFLRDDGISKVRDGIISSNELLMV